MKHLLAVLLFLGALGLDRTIFTGLSSPAPSSVPQIQPPFTPYQLDLNSARAEELEGLPSIGSRRAKQILLYRKERGSFQSLRDLRKIPGIGPKSLLKISPLVILSNQREK